VSFPIEIVEFSFHMNFVDLHSKKFDAIEIKH
jgi:hypothetical protein